MDVASRSGGQLAQVLGIRCPKLYDVLQRLEGRVSASNTPHDRCERMEWREETQ
jgi:hypothetical protein